MILSLLLYVHHLDSELFHNVLLRNPISAEDIKKPIPQKGDNYLVRFTRKPFSKEADKDLVITVESHSTERKCYIHVFVYL
jgi:hypothetical protein